VLLVPAATDATGSLTVAWSSWPAGIAPTTALVFQLAVTDAGSIHGVALSNALQALTP